MHRVAAGFVCLSVCACVCVSVCVSVCVCDIKSMVRIGIVT